MKSVEIGELKDPLSEHLRAVEQGTEVARVAVARDGVLQRVAAGRKPAQPRPREDPFPTSIRSLDAIHLATALLVRIEHEDLVFATHDGRLATAARAVGFDVIGAGR